MTTSFENQIKQKTSMKGFMASLKRRSLVIGIILMFLYTWAFDLSNSGVLSMQLPLAVYLTTGWGFFFVALFMTRLTLGGKATITLLKRFLIWRVDRKWYFMAFLLLLGLQFASVLLTALLTGVPSDISNLKVFEVVPLSMNALVLIVPWFLFEMLPNGEEIACRGYVLPRLQTQYSALTSSLIVGVIWSVWHLPKFLGTGPNSGRSFAWFTVFFLATAVLYTWLYNNSRGSLLLVTLFHAANNTEGAFRPISFTVPGGILGNWMTVLYVIAAIVVIILAGPARLSRMHEKQVQN